MGILERLRMRKPKKELRIVETVEDYIECPKCRTYNDINEFYRIWEWYAPLRKGTDPNIDRVSVITAMYQCVKCKKKFPKSVGGYIYDGEVLTKHWGYAPVYEGETKVEDVTLKSPIVAITFWKWYGFDY